jgi:hypothetical protein
MKDKIIRKEVYLTEEVVKELQKQAESEGRLLKNYMEQILVKQAKKGK